MTGALVIVIGYLLVANHRDRTSYERAMRRRDAEHAAELAATRAAHDADLTGMRSRLSSLEQRLAELETELDRERDRRRRAEDDAATASATPNPPTLTRPPHHEDRVLAMPAHTRRQP
jgi:hypothetical protein